MREGQPSAPAVPAAHFSSGSISPILSIIISLIIILILGITVGLDIANNGTHIVELYQINKYV